MPGGELIVLRFGDFVRRRGEFTAPASWCEIFEFVGLHPDEALAIEGNDSLVGVFILEAGLFFSVAMVNDDDTRETHAEVFFEEFGHILLPCRHLSHNVTFNGCNQSAEC